MTLGSVFAGMVVFTAALASAAPAPAPSLDELDALYVRRDDPAAGEALERALTEAIAKNPDDYELLWRMARYKWWLADGSPREAKALHAGEGRAMAERALAVRPRGVEAMLFGAINIGVYAQAIGMLRALTQGLERRFVSLIDGAIAADPTIFDGAPLTVKGRYYFEIPWPKRSVERAKELLGRCVAAHPANLRARLYLAEALFDDGEVEAAHAMLELPLRGVFAADPPEGKRIMQRAENLARRLAAR